MSEKTVTVTSGVAKYLAGLREAAGSLPCAVSDFIGLVITDAGHGEIGDFFDSIEELVRDDHAFPSDEEEEE